MNKLTERIFNINKRKQEIRSQIEANAEGLDLDALELELRSLDTEFTSIEKRMKTLDSITIPKPEERGNEIMELNKDNILETPEYRTAWLKKMQGKTLNEVEQRAYTTASDSAGAAIPTQTGDQFISKLQEVAPLLNEITLLKVTGNVTFAAEGVRDGAAIHTQNAAVTPASDAMVEISLGGYKFIKIISISENVATMAIDAFESWLTDMLSEDIGRKIEYYIINGSGSSQPTGVEKANTWDETNSVTVEATKNLTYTNVLALIGLLKGGYDKNAKFLMSKKTLWGSFMPLKDDSKYPLVSKENGMTYIMGYPVLLSDNVAENIAYLGDFKKMVGNLSQDVNVTSAPAFRNDSIDFKGTALFDCKPAIGEAFVKLSKASE